ncbi:uncharacterized protein [Primulina eburnea]
MKKAAQQETNGRFRGVFTRAQVHGEIDIGTLLNCGGEIAVEVENGLFNWEDNSGKEIVKNLNFEFGKGELAAIVGLWDQGSLPFWRQFLARLTNYQERSEYVVPQPMSLKHHGSKVGQYKKTYYLAYLLMERDTRKLSGCAAWRKTWK